MYNPGDSRVDDEPCVVPCLRIRGRAVASDVPEIIDSEGRGMADKGCMAGEEVDRVRCPPGCEAARGGRPWVECERMSEACRLGEELYVGV